MENFVVECFEKVKNCSLFWKNGVLFLFNLLLFLQSGPHPSHPEPSASLSETRGTVPFSGQGSLR